MITADRWREQRIALHTTLLPRLPQHWMVAAARALGLEGADGQIHYDRPEQIAACADLVLYALPEGHALLIVASADAEAPTLDPALREALGRPRYRLLVVTRASADRPGGAEVRDLAEGRTAWLAEPQLAHAQHQGAFLASHVIEGPDFWLTTGVPLRIDPELARRIQARPDLQGASRVATVTRSQWSLLPPPTAPAPARPVGGGGGEGGGRRPGRQDPCPCGSGKPYRRCHGRR